MGICRLWLFFFFFAFPFFIRIIQLVNSVSVFVFASGFQWMGSFFFYPGFVVSCEGKHFTDPGRI